MAEISKVDQVRALREARYERGQKQAKALASSIADSRCKVERAAKAKAKKAAKKKTKKRGKR